MVIRASKINSLGDTPVSKLSDSAIQLIGSLMQVCGIRHIKVEPIQCGGVSRARAVDAQFFEGVPDEIKAIGGSVLEPVSDLVLSFAVTDVDMEPAAGDLDHLRKVWALGSGKKDQRLVTPAEVTPDMKELDIP